VRGKGIRDWKIIGRKKGMKRQGREGRYEEVNQES
jgi:hypothetical protein